MTQYRPVTDFPGYRVGNDGSVWTSLKQHGPGIGWKPTDEWRLMSLCKDGFGYPSVRLCNGGRMVNRRAHWLVLTCFVGPCPIKHEACHRDGDPSNNRLDNLYWGTRLDNARDMVSHGTSHKGERHPLAKLSEKEVIDIHNRAASGERRAELAKEFGVCIKTISHIATWKRWSHLRTKVKDI